MCVCVCIGISHNVVSQYCTISSITMSGRDAAHPQAGGLCYGSWPLFTTRQQSNTALENVLSINIWFNGKITHGFILFMARTGGLVAAMGRTQTDCANTAEDVQQNLDAARGLPEQLCLCMCVFASQPPQKKVGTSAKELENKLKGIAWYKQLI